MSSSLRRGALAAAALAFSIATLAACAAGNNAQTLQVQPDNAATSVGDIKVQNAIVVTQPDRKATGPIAISATLFNSSDRDQTLESITVPGDGTAEIKPAKGSGKVIVPAGGSVVLGGEGNASAVVSEAGDAVQDGNAQEVTFTFSETGDVSLRAFVVPAESFFEGWGPTEIPQAPGTTPDASGKPSSSPSSSASDSEEGEEPDQAGSQSPSNSASG